MRMQSVMNWAVAAACVVLAGCAVDTDVRKQENMGPLLAPSERHQGMNQNRPPTYIKRRSPRDSRMEREISIQTSGMALAEILDTVAPDLSLRVKDSDVDLSRRIPLYVKRMPLKDFIAQLGDLTGYHFEANGRVLSVSTTMSKTWNVAALSSKREVETTVGGSSASGDNVQAGGTGTSSGSSGGSSRGGSGSNSEQSGTEIKSTYDEDPWEQLLEDARRYVGLDADTPSANDIRVVGVRSLGTITASGPPGVIRSLDQFMSEVSDQSQRQVHLDMKAFEVSLNDRRGRGINWEVLANTTIDGDPFIYALSTEALSQLAEPFGETQGAAAFSNDNVQAQALVEFLGEFGTVELLTEPNMTVLNGETAYIASVDEFSFVASVTQFISNEGTQTITPELSRIRVGVTMAVTPRLLEDDRILIEVTPVISSLQGFDNFNVGDVSFQNPNIALSELSTQVVTRSGQPVQLGGLIQSRISEAMNRLPNDKRGGLLDFIFGSTANELERRELVLTITPRLVEA